jgi:hypothetical protein
LRRFRYGGGGRIRLVAGTRPVQVSQKFFYSVGELRIDLVPEDSIAKIMRES